MRVVVLCKAKPSYCDGADFDPAFPRRTKRFRLFAQRAYSGAYGTDNLRNGNEQVIKVGFYGHILDLNVSIVEVRVEDILEFSGPTPRPILFTPEVNSTALNRPGACSRLAG